MIRAARTAACLGALALGGGAASAECRLALALGLDVSASVDAQEYRLQVEGLAAALLSPPVRQALLAAPGAPVALAVFEWSGWADQRLLLDWVLVENAAVLDGAVARLVTTGRTPMEDATALGTALLYGGDLLARSPGCARQVLDISGDGENNDGVDPDMLGPEEPALRGVTVNALVIGAEATGPTDLRQAQIGVLARYFDAHVIRGPGAFVEVALGFRDYERAMRRKLLREIETYALSGLASGTTGARQP